MITVQAQRHDGTETFNQSSDQLTRQEIISDAVDTLFTTGGVIKCDDRKYLVQPGQDFAIQDNEQEWL